MLQTMFGKVQNNGMWKIVHLYNEFEGWIQFPLEFNRNYKDND